MHADRSSLWETDENLSVPLITAWIYDLQYCFYSENVLTKYIEHLQFIVLQTFTQQLQNDWLGRLLCLTGAIMGPPVSSSSKYIAS